MDEMDVPKALKGLSGIGAPLVPEETSFFLSRQTPLATKIKGMALWRERLFAWMMRNAESPMGYFCLPPHRVVELWGHRSKSNAQSLRHLTPVDRASTSPERDLTSGMARQPWDVVIVGAGPAASTPR